MWVTGTIIHVILWLVWKKVGQGRKASISRAAQSPQRCQATKSRRIHRRTIRCIRRRSRSPRHRCTACTVISAAIFAASTHAGFANVFTADCRQSRPTGQVTENFVASTCKQDRKGGGQNFEIGKFTCDHSARLAQVCTWYATANPTEAPRMCELSISCQCRAQTTKDRASWTSDPEARRNSCEPQFAAASNPTGDSSTGSQPNGFQIATGQCTANHICTGPNGHGNRCNHCQPRPCSECPCTVYDDAGLSDGTRDSSIGARAMYSTMSCTGSSSAFHDNDTQHPIHVDASAKPSNALSGTSRRLDMATQSASDARNAIVASHRPGPTDAKCDPATRFATAVYASAEPASSPASSHTSTGRSAHCQPRSSQFSPDPDIGNSSQRAERIANRTGRGGRVRFECQPHSTANRFCQSTASMSCTVESIQPAHASCYQGSFQHCSRRCTSPDATTSITHGDAISGEPDARHQCKDSGWQHTHHAANDTCSDEEQSTRAGHNVNSQLTIQGQHARGHGDSTIFTVTQRPKTTKNPKASAREHLYTDRGWSHSTSTIHRRQPDAYTCPDRDPVRCRGKSRPELAAVGIERCEELNGSSALLADRPRASTVNESPQAQHQGSTILLLDQAIPMTPKEVSMHQIRELYPLLCKPWPDSAMMWGHNFVSLLPDLDPAIRSLVTSTPCWSGEPVLEVHLYIDGKF